MREDKVPKSDPFKIRRKKKIENPKVAEGPLSELGQQIAILEKHMGVREEDMDAKDTPHLHEEERGQMIPQKGAFVAWKRNSQARQRDIANSKALASIGVAKEKA